jgi:hypothetical protein
VRHCYVCKDDASGVCEHLRKIDQAKKADKERQKANAKRIFKQAKFKAVENEGATIRLMSATTKKCPKEGCAVKIQRKTGCSHFICERCKTHFCWACKVIWKNKQALHLNTCKYGTKTTVSMASLDKSDYAPGWDVDQGYDTANDEGLWLPESQQ